MSEKFIEVNLTGGLGNQMFQFAAAYALSKKLNFKLNLNLDGFRKNPRPFELDIFNINFSEILITKKNTPSNILFNFCKKNRLNNFKERHPFVYDDNFNLIDGPCNLIGYFQSERYFSKYESDIRRNFNFKNEFDIVNRDLATLIGSVNSVSIHIRRGDYIANKSANQYHGVCPISYYISALDFLSIKVPNIFCFIFSDDPGWVSNSFKINYPYQIIKHNLGNNSWNDMRLMTQCKFNIIANSSFSWWGAWLNSYKDKIVIAPKKWVASDKEPVTDILPPQWIQV